MPATNCAVGRAGKAKYENGAVYEGAFEDDQRSGWGTQCFPDESLYIGEWANDTMTGCARKGCPKAQGNALDRIPHEMQSFAICRQGKIDSERWIIL